MPQPRNETGSNVITFRLAEPAARRRADAIEPETERGTLLLFTGVQYVRMDDDRLDSWPYWDEAQTESA